MTSFSGKCPDTWYSGELLSDLQKHLNPNLNPNPNFIPNSTAQKRFREDEM